MGHSLTTLKIGACVATESHLRREGLKNARIPGNGDAANFCPQAKEEGKGGGVSILVSTRITGVVETPDERMAGRVVLSI